MPMAFRLVIRAVCALSLATLPLCAHAAAPNVGALSLQVALDRANFSPGVIDGAMGRLTRQAIKGFQEANGINSTGSLDAETKAALKRQAEATETVDVAVGGPLLASIPESMADKAKLDTLSYTSIEEALSEKYHTTPKLLRALNPGADFAPGHQITVPAVRLAGDKAEGATGWEAMLDQLSVAKVQASAAKVVVDRSDRQVRAFDSAGKLLGQFPATIGSEHDPLPLGEWKIRGVARLPAFNYNPDLFWDAAVSDAKEKLPPGPNGPVGVVWIDLSKDHYGIHGTPEPEMIGRTESHGCIRLTNWDAAKLAQMVRPGTPVTLQE